VSLPGGLPGEPGAAGPPAGEWWGTDRVTVRYGSKLALDQVTFRAEPGRVSVVVGGDGSGRSTLLRCLAGALAAGSGEVRRPAPERIGYLPRGSGIYPDLSVAENLAFRAAAYRVPAAEARQRGGELLARTGLAGVTGRLAGRLSGGMRQKLGVIAAMLHRPGLLVLDEPTTGVDPVSRAELWWLIARAAADGAAVVLATSYLDEAERAWHVLALDAGRVLAWGTPDQIVASMPGTLWATDQRPGGDAARRSWLRERRWRVWEPDGDAAPGGGGTPGEGAPGGGAPGVEGLPAGAAPAGMPAAGLVRPDLQDGVTVAELARELAGQQPAAAGGEGER
jgi:ABC-2 type transport system ATP-binding protein